MDMNINLSNEYGRLKSVLLYKPTNPIVYDIDSADDALFEEIPDYDKIVTEIESYVKLLKSLDVNVYQFDNPLDPNSIYAKDLIIAGNSKVVVCNPKYDVRRGEKGILERFFMNNNIECYTSEDQDMYFEGADFFWLNKNEALLNCGARTSIDAVNYLSEVFNIKIHTSDVGKEYRIPQHLLGALHVISEDTVAIRYELTGNVFKQFGYKNEIRFNEDNEITSGYSMNIVSLSNKELIIPSGNPNTKNKFEQQGYKVYTTPVSEISKMGGALACMTAILERD